mmetsp:Transcript_11391/g.33584  ORF Transcript_11391/g.33584 Transcript_11391/m.33584 type:complete len:204 (-) Transcript_11391:179-790(-)
MPSLRKRPKARFSRGTDLERMKVLRWKQGVLRRMNWSFSGAEDGIDSGPAEVPACWRAASHASSRPLRFASCSAACIAAMSSVSPPSTRRLPSSSSTKTSSGNSPLNRRLVRTGPRASGAARFLPRGLASFLVEQAAAASSRPSRERAALFALMFSSRSSSYAESSSATVAAGGAAAGGAAAGGALTLLMNSGLTHCSLSPSS